MFMTSNTTEDTRPQQEPRFVPPPPLVPVVRAELIDRAACAELDPLLEDGACLPLWHVLTAPVELAGADGPILRLTPDAGEATREMVIAVYARVVELAGTDDTGESTDAWEEEGRTAMLAAAPSKAMREARLRQWDGSLPARISMQENIGRSFGMIPESIAAFTGRPYVARKGMIPTCLHVPRLEEEKRAAEEAERKTQQMEARLDEEARARAARQARMTLRELGIDGVIVKKPLGWTFDPAKLDECAPFRDAPCVAEDGRTRTYAWSGLVALVLCLPTFEADGIRSLDLDQVPPPGLRAAPEASTHALLFVQKCREQFGAFDRGPVREWSKGAVLERALERADELVTKHAFAFGTAAWPHRMWVQGLLAGAVVRGLRVPPQLAEPMFLRVADSDYAMRNQPMKIPTRHVKHTNDDGDEHTEVQTELVETAHSWIRPSEGNVMIGNLLVSAAEGGDVQPGCLLDEPEHETKTAPAPKKRGR